MSLFLVVGTTPFGWNELVRAVDDVARSENLSGSAQIGNGTYEPTALSHERFVPHDVILENMRSADITVIHGGLGSIGDALRNARRLVVAPRTLGIGRHGRQEAPNDQWPVALRLAEVYGFDCVPLSQIGSAITSQLERPPQRWSVPTGNATHLIEEWLAAEGLRINKGPR
ncbi:UNVERIFIED_ORG: hypothetical protein E4P37_16435 [Bacillus sp. AZ43]